MIGIIVLFIILGLPWSRILDLTRNYLWGYLEKSGGPLDIVENVVEGYFKRKVILQKFRNSWYSIKVLKPMVFYGGS